MVIRDSGSTPIDAGWLVGEKRWTVSDMRRRIECIVDGLGFAWLPEPMIEDLLAGGKLKRLRLCEGAYRMVPLYRDLSVISNSRSERIDRTTETESSTRYGMHKANRQALVTGLLKRQ
jgi:DNA-binding transcriptional LysR family regulator